MNKQRRQSPSIQLVLHFCVQGMAGSRDYWHAFAETIIMDSNLVNGNDWQNYVRGMLSVMVNRLICLLKLRVETERLSRVGVAIELRKVLFDTSTRMR